MTKSGQHVRPVQRVDGAEGGAAATPPRRYLSIVELSCFTTLSVATLRRLVKRGLLVGYQPGGPRTRIVFPPDAIEQAARATSEEAAPALTTPLETPQTPQRGPRPKWLENS